MSCWVLLTSRWISAISSVGFSRTWSAYKADPRYYADGGVSLIDHQQHLSPSATSQGRCAVICKITSLAQCCPFDRSLIDFSLTPGSQRGVDAILLTKCIRSNPLNCVCVFCDQFLFVFEIFAISLLRGCKSLRFSRSD